MKQKNKRILRKIEAVVLSVFLFIQMLPVGTLAFPFFTEAAENEGHVTVTVSSEGEGSVEIAEVFWTAPEETTGPAISMEPSPTPGEVSGPAVDTGDGEVTGPAVDGPGGEAGTPSPEPTAEPTARPEPVPTGEATQEPSPEPVPTGEATEEPSSGPGAHVSGKAVALSVDFDSDPDDPDPEPSASLEPTEAPETSEPDRELPGESREVTPGAIVTIRLTPADDSIRLAGIRINGETVEPELMEDTQCNRAWLYTLEAVGSNMEITGLFEAITVTEGSFSEYVTVEDGEDKQEGENHFIFGCEDKTYLYGINDWELLKYEDTDGREYKPEEIRQTIDIKKLWLENGERPVLDKDRFRIVSLKEPLCIIMDSEKPVITGIKAGETSAIVTPENDGSVTIINNGAITVTVSVENPGRSGIKNVWYCESEWGYPYIGNGEATDWIKKAKKTGEGTYTFTVKPQDLDFERDFYIWAYNKSGKYSDLKKVRTVIAGRKPTVAILNKERAERVTSGNVLVRGEAKAGSIFTSVQNVFYGKKAYEPIAPAQLSGNEFTFEISETPTKGAIYYVWAVGSFGIKSETDQVRITIDRTEPVISKILMLPEVKNGWNREAVTVKAEVRDLHPKALIYSEYEDGREARSTDCGKDGKAEFSVNKKAFQGSYYLWAVDEAGNKSKKPCKADIKIDRLAPEITGIGPEEAVVSDGETARIVKNEAFRVRLDAEDSGGSGIKGVYVSTASKDYEEALSGGKAEGAFEAEKAGEGWWFDAGADPEKSGRETYYIWVCDEAGNVSKCRKLEVIIDKENPEARITDKAQKEKLTKNEVAVHVETSDEGGSGIGDVYYSSEGEYREGQKAVFSGRDGIYTFLIDNKKSRKEVYYVWAVDRAGNRSLCDRLTVNIDVDKPVIKAVRKSPDTASGWNSGAVDISVEIEDSNRGGIFYNTVNNRANAIKLENSSQTVTFSTDNSEFDGSYYIWAYDTAGNETDRAESIQVKIDLQDPVIRLIDIQQKNTSAAAKAIRFLSFGMFFNESVEVTVSAEDEGVSSGIHTIILYGDGQEIGRQEASSGMASFSLEVPFDKELSAVATDNVGHESDPQRPEDVNTEIPNSKLVLETDKPVVSIEAGQSTYRDAGGNDWYSAAADVMVRAEDKSSGLYSVAVLINDKPVTLDREGRDLSKPFETAKETSKEFHLSTSQALADEHGSYRIAVTVTDNAGNVTEENKTLYMDTTRPEIVKYEFIGDGNQEAGGEPSNGDEYAYYFREKTKVIITARDEGASSGIQSITYYAVDYTLDAKGARSREITVPVDANNQISFTLAPGFKGNIYARATDYAGNKSESEEGPAGITVESRKSHQNIGSISIELPDTSYTDGEGLPLFAGDTEVSVKVEDSFSGIKSLAWSVEADYDKDKNEAGTIEIDNDGTVNTESEQFRTARRDKNLITGMKGKLRVGHNSNRIRIRVSMTDRAGNKTEETVSFSIDKTAPTVEISYDNDSFDPDFTAETKYFKDPRTATITVRERNFDPQKAECTITGSNGAVPAAGPWTQTKDDADPDNTAFTARVPFDADGDYTFRFGTEDRAGNASAQTGEEAFTIDRTIPEIAIDFDNTDSENGGYYKEDRTATITIKEHNFETSRVVLEGTATEKGRDTQYPEISSFTSNGDFHTASVTFPGDARYSLKVGYTDKAGNKAEEAEAEDFVVDRNAPVIKISGLLNRSANNGKLAPLITFIDKAGNLDEKNIKISLQVLGAGAAQYKEQKAAGTFRSVPDGKSFQFSDIPHTRDKDGMYRLKVEAHDMSGNKIKRQMEFSVNRFGSVYEFDAALRQAAGKYVRREFDVVVTETNVDDIDMGKLQMKLIKNGEPMDLKAGADYTVSRSGGTDQWKQYQYTIKAGLFNGDGTYRIDVSSKDAAGNWNENMEESKDAEVWFGVDKTPPVVVPLNLEDKKTYVEEEKTASIQVSDNLVLSKAEIYFNQEKQECEVENETYSFLIPDSDKKCIVTAVAVDAAGNRTERKVVDFYVTTSSWVRFKNNKPLVAACAATAAAVPTIPLANSGMRWLLKRRRLLKGLFRK